MKLSGLIRLAVCLAFPLLGRLALATPPTGEYHLIMKYTIGGEGVWDYPTFDASTGRLYLTHGDRVNVIDTHTWSLVGDIPGMHLAHSVVVLNELGRGFISDGSGAVAVGGSGDRVVIFDLKSLAVLGQVKTGIGTDYMLYDPASRHIFAFNPESKDASVIDPAQGTVLATISLGGKTEDAVSDGKGMIWVNIIDTDEVLAIDSHAHTVKARWPIKHGAGPSSMDMDREHRRLFIGDKGDRLCTIMDADNGKIIQTFPIGGIVDSTVYDPETGLAFFSTVEGMLSIFHEDSPSKFRAVQTVYSPPGARTLALDPKTHNLFSVTADFGLAPSPTPQRPNPRPKILPGTFVLLVYGR